MPEVRFNIRWPDGSEESCYSPSTVIHDYFKAGQSYELGEFVELSRAALTQASERVQQRFGFFCTGAQQQLDSLLRKAATQPAGSVLVTSLK